VPSEAEISWADPIVLDFVAAMEDKDRLLRLLRKQLRDAIAEQRFVPTDLKRCVYVVRMRGPVVVAYPVRNSPVLYVGRGDAPGRLATHLGNWMREVHKFGSGVGVELRICVPRRRKRQDFYKYVEADLIHWFQKKYGAIPFFNSRREQQWESCVEYSATSERELRQALGVGSGNRPQWAIRPLPANEGYEVFHKGFDPGVWGD
jgi:hypothetical protein